MVARANLAGRRRAAGVWLAHRSAGVWVTADWKSAACLAIRHTQIRCRVWDAHQTDEATSISGRYHGAMSDALMHQRANQLVIDAMTAAGLSAELAPRDLPAQVVISAPDGTALLIVVLVREGPHARGGGGNVGLHWMTRDTPAAFIACVDLSRGRACLFPIADFRERAQPASGGRLHLDWLVARAASTRVRVADESEFDSYTFERALPELAGRLTAQRAAR
jgi:hypothetical protein